MHTKSNGGVALLVDFIDQVRHGDVLINGTRVTHSLYLDETLLLEGKNYEKIPFQMDAWKEACVRIAGHIQKNYKIIIVNPGYYSLQAINADPNVFDSQKSTFLTMNSRLNEMCSFFISVCKNAYLLERDDTLLHADGDHKWGLAPFHYTERFYFIRLSQIEKVVRDASRMWPLVSDVNLDSGEEPMEAG